MTVERVPSQGSLFWQKNTPKHYPDWIPRVKIQNEEGDREVSYALINDLRSLLFFVNQGTVTFHPWLSRVEDLERPDFVLFDLDPEKGRFQDAVTLARGLHDLLAEEGIKSYVKTSGKSGLHVLVRWDEVGHFDGSYEEARHWALEIAGRLVRRFPKIASTERRIKKRHGKVYVDVIQNARGHHGVPPYVVRATPEATVSMPLEWSEVTSRLDPRHFTIRNAIHRIKRKGDLLEPLIHQNSTASRNLRKAA
jgi:bifunctional non-homologous end joining protein LigD